jgi:ABC-type dipeptide/oligopeptide/nickel transport system permease subunit
VSTSEAALRQTADAFVPQGHRLLRRMVRDRSAVVGVVIIAVVGAAALLAPWLAGHDPIATDFSHRFAGPSRAHLFGTDNLGRDEFSRILHGARLSLGMAVTATVGIAVIGVLLGLLAAMYGRLVDTLTMRVADVFLALPTLILALVVVGLLGQGLRNLIITIVFVQWPSYARIVRGMALKIRERDFVEAARAVGASRPRIVLRHVLPNLVGPIVVLSTLDMGRVLLAVSGLSFLGFGVSPPTPEWGAMLADAKTFLDRAPQLLVWPGLAITLMVLAFNLAGDGLRDLLDPRTVESTPGWERRRKARRALGASPPPPPDVADDDQPVPVVPGS